MNEIVKCADVADLKAVAQQLLSKYDKSRVFAFHGSMGVGKTTFIKALCEVVGVADMVNSPTFAIMNEYEDQQQQAVYHFDFYRIKDQEEALDIGIDDYLYSGHYCFIEWPQKISAYLPEDSVEVKIEKDEITGIRSFHF